MIQLSSRRCLRTSLRLVAVAASAILVGCLAVPHEEPQQAVFWYGLSAAQGATCISAKTYSFPDNTARDTIVGTDGVGTRAEDGSDYVVQCSVTPSSAGGPYNVNLRFSGGDVGNFVASGSLTAPAAAGADTVDTDATLDVDFDTTDLSLSQTGCTAKVHTLVPGAVWLQSLNCPTMKDPSSPSISCTGTGGVIFENCAH